MLFCPLRFAPHASTWSGPLLAPRAPARATELRADAAAAEDDLPLVRRIFCTRALNMEKITSVGFATLAAALERGALPALEILDLVDPNTENGPVDDPAIEAVYAARPSLTNTEGQKYPFVF